MKLLRFTLVPSLIVMISLLIGFIWGNLTPVMFNGVAIAVVLLISEWRKKGKP